MQSNNVEIYGRVAHTRSVAINEVSLVRHKRFLWCYVSLYAFAWTVLTFLTNSSVPGGDAIEAFNWAANLDWGTTRSGWTVGLFIYPAMFFDSVIARSFYWYFVHFAGVGIGIFGVWTLAFRLTCSIRLAWLAVFLMNLSAIVSTDAQNQNDNYLLIMMWPWMFYFFIRAGFDDARFWLPFAFIAGVATMAKYSTLAFVGSVFLLTLAIPSLRRHYRSPWFYAAMACFFALVLPNIFWIVEHNFVSINWFLKDANRGLALSTLESVAMVFSNVLVPCVVFLLMGIRFRWPASPEARRAIICMLLPLVPITLYLFLFPTRNPSRITEWMIPFSILAPPLFVACISHMPATLMRRTYVVLVAAGAVVFVGYGTAKSLNWRNSYYSGYGETVVSAKGQELWHARYNSELRYVGGSHVAGVATLYASDFPAILMQWTAARQPNIFTRDLRSDDVRQHGALLFGAPGTSCQVADFSPVLAAWPGMEIDARTEIIFPNAPSATTQPICLAFVAPIADVHTYK